MVTSDFDGIIKKWSDRYQLPWRLIKAQVWQESDFNPQAVSSCGAMGLMQLMAPTAREMGLDSHEIFDPEWNVQAGCKYDRLQYDHFPEIPDPEERLSFMLAAYNGGRGYINKAMELAYEGEFGETLSRSHNGRPGGWQKWGRVAPFLYASKVNGRTPDANQIINYVESIWEKYHKLMEAK
jgi:soluble lytic murein transglycosylase-like protein